ncbi:MAG TPA: 3-phosphoserine/phosphohydroxythreonine transaminase [Bacteroidales bacterium]|nr:3-phosphoserine/phosphohydroxythreonine transaminase [Bacteroidales bacterium]HNS47117.1 3-phosphoserine/phosphohydroxythreonine transaminase [Bacteroidales bacterium]
MKKHNFNAGPSILPQYTLENTAKAVLDLNGIGMSIMEISHRSKEFQAIIDEAATLFKELLDIPEGYSVLFLGGGASLQFAMVPYNFLNTKAAYLNTGEWASKAIKEAKIFGEVEVVASSQDKNFNYIPKNFVIPKDVDYFHFTTNNTIFGTEIRKDPDCPVPLIADMSSDIFSRPVNISKYALIYGGAQKNLAPAGVTFVIINNDLISKVQRQIPTMLKYQTHIDKGSMFNTPPCVNIYAALQTLKWLKASGGIKAMEKKNLEKAGLLYQEIERNKYFIPTIPDPQDRSIMNVCFVMKEEYKELEPAFQQLASSRGMIGIKGHRSVGGFRASLYNALPIESVRALIDVMQEFEKTNG